MLRNNVNVKILFWSTFYLFVNTSLGTMDAPQTMQSVDAVKRLFDTCLYIFSSFLHQVFQPDLFETSLYFCKDIFYRIEVRLVASIED